jgi:hypothetical protein
VEDLEKVVHLVVADITVVEMDQEAVAEEITAVAVTVVVQSPHQLQNLLRLQRRHQHLLQVRLQ